jgi:hypothetical protein
MGVLQKQPQIELGILFGSYAAYLNIREDQFNPTFQANPVTSSEVLKVSNLTAPTAAAAFTICMAGTFQRTIVVHPRFGNNVGSACHPFCSIVRQSPLDITSLPARTKLNAGRSTP